MINIDFMNTLDKDDAGLHVLITDACTDIDLYDNKEKISELQRESMLHNDFARNFILYLNKVVIDEFIFSKETSVPLICPNCNKKYILTKPDYDFAFEKYKEYAKK